MEEVAETIYFKNRWNMYITFMHANDVFHFLSSINYYIQACGKIGCDKIPDLHVN